jgi:hypothetical protein
MLASIAWECREFVFGRINIHPHGFMTGRYLPDAFLPRTLRAGAAKYTRQAPCTRNYPCSFAQDRHVSLGRRSCGGFLGCNDNVVFQLTRLLVVLKVNAVGVGKEDDFAERLE